MELARQEIHDGLELESPEISLFEKYIPQDEWFEREQELDGLHGIGHHTRVLVLAEHIARSIETPETPVDFEVIRIAASIHDSQRKCDVEDSDHGKRAAQFAREMYQDTISQATLDKVIHTVEWHDKPHGSCPQPMQLELLVLREADKLDRQRDRKRNGNFDPNRLQLEVSTRYIETADVFHKLSKWYELQGMDPFYAVMEAGIELGLVLNE